MRFDPCLEALGWKIAKGDIALHPHGAEEEEADTGHADCAPWLQSDIVGIVEAKRGYDRAQNVVTQAGEFKVPFRFSTNAEVFWFHDLRHQLKRPHRVAKPSGRSA